MPSTAVGCETLVRIFLRNVVSGSQKSSWGKRSSIAFATSGGVNTSSVERLAIKDSTSGLYAEIYKGCSHLYGTK